MKTKILSFFVVAAMALGLASCSESWEPKTDKTGQLALSSLGVEVAGGEDVINSNVNPRPSRAEVDLKPFVVRIYKDNGDLYSQMTYGEMPEIITLPVGNYSVKVSSHEVKKAEWEHPLFEGEKSFKIEDSKITNVGSIKCTFASLKVSVRFTDDLRKVMGSDVQVKVVANDVGELIFTPAETRSGYYEVIEGSTTLAASFTGTVMSVKENINKVYTDIKAGQHRIITFSLKRNPQQPDPSTGWIDPNEGIYVDTSVEDENISGDVPVDEDPENPERPGGEDFNDGVEVTSSLDFSKVYNPADVTDATVNISAKKGVASLTLSMPALADLSNIDLAAATSAPYGLPYGAAVKDQNSVSLNLLNVVAAVKDIEGKHSLTITVVDNAGIRESRILNLEVKAQGGNENAIVFTTDPVHGIKDNTPVAANTPGLDGKLDIQVAAGIKNMILDINSTHEDFFSLVSMLSGADLAHPGELAEVFDGFQIVNGAQVLNQTHVEFDITMFFTMLASFDGSHTFKITVIDNDGNEKSYTIILTV